MKIALLLFLSAVFSFSYGIEFKGEIADEIVWTIKESPVIIKGDVFVLERACLKIMPNVKVIIDGYFGFIVKGSLEAVGEKGREIVFTREQTNPKALLWKGITFYGEQCKSILSDCTIEYAFRNLCQKTSPILGYVNFRKNHYALYYSAVKSATVINNTFTNNTYAIYCDYSSPAINKNIITNNNIGIYCIFSSAPIIGQNTLKDNMVQDIFSDNSMGENAVAAKSQLVWSLVRGMF